MPAEFDPYLHLVARDLAPSPRYNSLFKVRGAPTFIDLFAGAGGLSLGLELAGFRCVGVVEANDTAGKTFKKNLSSTIPVPEMVAVGGKDGDVRNVDFKKWRALLAAAGVTELDLIAGGPPCQAFSRVGRGKLNALEGMGFVRDPRNALWRQFLRAVSEMEPRAFLIENVPGMLHHGGRNVAEEICLAAEEVGYKVRCAVLNAAAFGVPQTRERLFILGIRSDCDVAPTLPVGNRELKLSKGHLGAHKTPRNYFKNDRFFLGTLVPVKTGRAAVTAGQALGDLPPLTAHRKPGYRASRASDPIPYGSGRPSAYAMKMRSWPGFQSEVVTDHVCKTTPRDYRTFAAMKEGDRYPDALVIAKKLFESARARWWAQVKRYPFGLPPQPKEEDFIPPYRDDSFHEKWRKLFRNQPSWTVTAHLAKDTYSHIHYDSKQARMITIREAARLQSFPDGFAFEGNVGECFRQIGNAVPPILAAGVGRHIVKLLASIDQAKKHSEDKTNGGHHVPGEAQRADGAHQATRHASRADTGS